MKSLLICCILFFVGLLLGGCIYSANASSTSNYSVSWAAPTTFTDGTAISGTLTYQVYAGASGQEVKQGSAVSASPFVYTDTTGAATECFKVSALVAGVESDLSDEVCASPPKVPSKPTKVVVTLK